MGAREFVDSVNVFIDSQFSDERERWTAELSAGEELVSLAQQYVLSGGKRLRAQFLYWGCVATGADPASAELKHAGAALEMLHAFALLHDDIMDGAETRRGLPTPNAALAQTHQANKWRGEDRRYGEGLAILLGDLVFVYAQLLAAELNEEARLLWSQLTGELVMGQYLDMQAAAKGVFQEEVSLAIARYKSGKYSVERPLQLGSAVGDKAANLNDVWSAFGVPLGEAFQLRDDVLGLLGDEDETGKPVGDDLREGKPTLLVSTAWSRADSGQRKLLDRIGRDDATDEEVEQIIALFHSLDVFNHIEKEIDRRLALANKQLDKATIPTEARAGLKELADSAVIRTR